MAANSFKRISRILIIDLNPPMSRSMLDNLTKSLLNVVCLFSTFKCNHRQLSVLGITAITNFCEYVLPLRQFKGELPRFHAAMSSLCNIFNEYDEIGDIDNAACLNEAFKKAIEQRLTLEKESSGAGKTWLQLEIIIFTTEELKSFASKVEHALSTVDLSSVRKIQIVRIVSATADFSSSDDDSAQSNSFGGVVDKLQINNYVFQFDIIFRAWLQNNDIDEERVHLNLPTIREEKLIIKCDTLQRILNPAQISHADQLLFDGEPRHSTHGSANCDNQNEICKLSAVSLIHETGICESTVFGIPILLRPTCCWQIDWSELEINQQSFNTLCVALRDKQLVLIVKSEREKSDFLHGHFAIFPSPKGNSLLLKSIAVNELLLPSPDLDFDQGIVSTEIKLNIEQSLSLVPIERVYAVEKYQCGLFRYILSKVPVHKKKLTRKM